MREKNIEQASKLPHPHSCHVKKLGKVGNRMIMKRDTHTHTHARAHTHTHTHTHTHIHTQY